MWKNSVHLDVIDKRFDVMVKLALHSSGYNSDRMLEDVV